MDGVSLGLGAAGGLLIYAGVKGYSIPSLLQAFVQGRSPSSAKLSASTVQAASAYPSVPFSGATGTASAASTSSIASTALKFDGAGYVWGGAPAKGVGNWDCSSFVNYVCGYCLDLPIPGYPAGSYDGSTHGPTTITWQVWNGLTTIGNGGSMQPGDLAIWETHMGIVTGDNQMISAQDPQLGTGISAVRGAIPGEVLRIRRYKTSAVTVVPSG